MTVEAIQDAVELELMASSRKDVAQKYIAYRNQRSVARKAKTRDMFLEIINIKSNDITRENANMNADTPAGMMMKFSSETTKPFVDDYLLSEEVKEAVSFFRSRRIIFRPTIKMTKITRRFKPNRIRSGTQPFRASISTSGFPSSFKSSPNALIASVSCVGVDKKIIYLLLLPVWRAF